MKGKLVKDNLAWIYTFTKKKLHPFLADPKEVCIRDIARALSKICRYTGHVVCDGIYSVAQHSVLVSKHCDPEYSLQGLLHDGSEYALTDVSTPLKRSGYLGDYVYYEHKLQAAIYKKFGVSEIEHQSVKKADSILLSTEANSLLPQPLPPEWALVEKPLDIVIEPLLPIDAEQLFLHRFRELTSLEDYERWIKE